MKGTPNFFTHRTLLVGVQGTESPIIDYLCATVDYLRIGSLSCIVKRQYIAAMLSSQVHIIIIVSGFDIRHDHATRRRTFKLL